MKRLKYQPHWEQQFPWLYLKVDSGPHAGKAFCKWCEEVAARVVLRQGKWQESAFVTEGFASWNKAIERFKRHQLAERHMESKKAIINKIKGTTMTSMFAQQQLANQLVLSQVFECCRYLARQALAFTGEDNDKNSNLVQLTKLVKAGKIGKKTYTHHDIQNEFIQLMSDGILRNFAKDVLSKQSISNCDKFNVFASWFGTITNIDNFSGSSI